MVSSITTKRGRVIQYELRLRKGSNRIVNNDLTALDAWLHQEAANEAFYYCDGYMAGLIAGMNPKKLSPADRDMLNEYLFGQEEAMLHNSAEDA
jgi:hypothetical protein